MDRDFLDSIIADSAVVDAVLLEHGRIVNGINFQYQLKDAVSAAGGRNLTAIRALLDEQAILGSDDREGAIQAAVRQVKKENPYLFESAVRQPYAAGVNASMGQVTMEDMGAMSMAEYRRYRRGE